ncbi:MAG: biotin/lipoate A/B protein ligase family protein [bacterium]
MGWDAALFEIAENEPVGAVLRLYSWSPPAISLGRFQDVARAVDAERAAAAGVEIVRRPTGGRAVLHDADLTYALVARHDDPVFGGSRFASQRVIGEALALALAILGVKADLATGDGGRGGGANLRGDGAHNSALATDARRTAPPCFSSAAREEIGVGGRKLLGSARREGRSAFLQHGSLPIVTGPAAIARFLPGDDAARAAAGARLAAHATSLRAAGARTITMDAACDAMRRAFEERARREFRIAPPAPRECALAERLAPEFAVTPVECAAPSASAR